MGPDRWLELKASSSGEDERVTSLLLELGGMAVEEREGALVTHVPPPPDLEAFLERARRELKRISPAGPPDLTWGWQAQEDWDAVWKRGLGPRKVTTRLTVSPSWVDYAPQGWELLITLDPGMAFGTAEHATTRGCLRGLSRYVGRGDRVADVGAGSGILSIAAALLGADQVVALELDPTSCRVAEENVTNNGVRDRVEIRHEPARPGVPIPGGPFQGIVANLQSGIILPLLPLFRSGLAPGGWLIASGILLEELDQVLRTLMKGGWYLLEGEEEGEWWTGVLSPEAPGG